MLLSWAVRACVHTHTRLLCACQGSSWRSSPLLSCVGRAWLGQTNPSRGSLAARTHPVSLWVPVKSIKNGNDGKRKVTMGDQTQNREGKHFFDQRKIHKWLPTIKLNMKQNPYPLLQTPALAIHFQRKNFVFRERNIIVQYVIHYDNQLVCNQNEYLLYAYQKIPESRKFSIYQQITNRENV